MNHALPANRYHLGEWRNVPNDSVDSRLHGSLNSMSRRRQPSSVSRGRLTAASVAVAVIACLMGCNDNGGERSAPSTPPSNATGIVVGGNVTGIAAGNRIVLANGPDTVALTADGPFVFSQRVPAGNAYRVTVSSITGAQECSVLRESGTAATATVTTIEVTCGPSDHSFVAAAPMLIQRARPILVPIADGTILAIGGFALSGQYLTTAEYLPSVERYDPLADRWTLVGSLPPDRVFDALPLDAGRILLLTSNGASYAFRILELASGTIVTAPPNASIVIGGPYTLSMLRLPDGKVFATDGAHVDLYDPLVNRWFAAAAPLQSGTGRAMVVLASGDVLFAGGTDLSGLVPLNESEIYDVAKDRWTQTGPLNDLRVGSRAILLPGGKVLDVGGYGGGGRFPRTPLSNAEVFDPTTGTWAPTGGFITVRDYDTFSTQRMPNGKVLLVGGSLPVGCAGVSVGNQCSSMYAVPTSLANTEVFDPATGAWSPGPSLRTARSGPAIALTKQGRLLVTGGTLTVPFAVIVNPFAANWSLVNVVTNEIGG